MGSGKTNQGYDIPLNKDTGSGFLILLIAFMTFLSILALSIGLIVNQVTERWITGLTGKVTIEIPAEAPDGTLMNTSQTSRVAEKIVDKLKNQNGIKTIRALEKTEIVDLISPWLGTNMEYADLPLPGLIEITIDDTSETVIAELEETAKTVHDNIKINNHRKWLTDFLNFTLGIKIFTFLIIFTIFAITALCVGGAVRSRMAIHKDELKLLHLMGASDNYIMRQFQRHTFWLALKGVFSGFALGYGFYALIIFVSKNLNFAFMPDYEISVIQNILIAFMPVIICAIAVYASKKTTFRELSRMP